MKRTKTNFRNGIASIADEFKKRKFIYVLKLENEKYYIGSTSKSSLRIYKHFNGSGASWTKLHVPVEVIEKIDLGIVREGFAEEEETKLTIKYMHKFGWRNVRGGYFVSCSEEETRKQLLIFKPKERWAIGFELE